jgi:predicted DNA-binding protein
MATSVRLDLETERLLERLARTRRSSKSAVLRDAIHLLAKPESKAGEATPYELALDLIGCVRGGPSDLSQRTGERFRRLLRERVKSR